MTWPAGTVIAGCPTASPPARRVVNRPNAKGEVELGPMREAPGMGDTLTVTPCAERISNAVMLLPSHLEQWGPLFDGLCRWRVTDNHPVFPFCAGRPVVESNLEICGFHVPGALPVVKVTPEEERWAKQTLATIRNPVAIVPTCRREWTHLRAHPATFWTPILNAISTTHTPLQFGYEDFPLLPGGKRMEWHGVRKLAAIYQQIGIMVTLNTGDYHLMLAVGGRCIVVEKPEREMPNNASIWKYPARPDRVRYCNFHKADEIIANFPWLYTS